MQVRESSIIWNSASHTQLRGIRSWLRTFTFPVLRVRIRHFSYNIFQNYIKGNTWKKHYSIFSADHTEMFSKQTQNVIRSIREIKTAKNAIYTNRMKCIEGNYLRCFRGSGSLYKKHILLNPDEPRFFAASYAWSFFIIIIDFSGISEV